MKIQLSSRTLKDLAKLGALSDDELSRLDDALGAMPMRVYPFDSMADVVREALSSNDAAAEIGNGLTSFLYAIAGASESPIEFVDTALEKLRKEEPARADRIGKFLSRLIGRRNLLLSFKSTALYEESEHLLLESKVLVDLRPVFDFASTTEVAASALLYKLRMTYRSPSTSEVETIIFTVRGTELSELGKVIQRAGLKAETLRGVTGMGTILETKE